MAVGVGSASAVCDLRQGLRLLLRKQRLLRMG
jgi:hypothetical protein